MDFKDHHPTEEILEEYLFQSLPEAEVEQIEEHLLVCHACVDAAERFIVFVESLRNTLEYRQPKARAASARQPVLDE